MTFVDTGAPGRSGVVTFLFTDIEGSTRRWEADANAMREALETHDGLLRETAAAQDCSSSPRTVQTHLTHAYAKLGLSSRIQLVQEVARRG